jgi:hypothetical protein
LKEGQVVNLRDVPLQAGLKVTGKLVDAVPRPVKNGKVIVWCLPKPAGDVYADENPSVYWEDLVDIDEDGTFTFPSIPKTGKIQMIAICDGWVITSSGPEGQTVSGVRYDLDSLEIDDNQVTDIELPMSPTGTLRVTVCTSEGDPIPGATVSVWPNQLLDQGGSTILGTGESTSQLIQKQIDPTWKIEVDTNNWDKGFTSKTDAEGVALIHNLPKGIPNYFGVFHDEFVLDKKDEAKRDLERVFIDGKDEEAVKELTIPMKPIKRP